MIIYCIRDARLSHCRGGAGTARIVEQLESVRTHGPVRERDADVEQLDVKW